MNWDAVGAISELVGAVLVLVTLVYVAAQIRQNTAAVATATYESVLSGFNSINMVVANDAEMARIAVDGLYTPEKLSDDQAIRLSFLMRSICNQWLKLLRLHQSGALNEADWEAFASEAAQVLSTPGGVSFREKNQLFADLYKELEAFEAQPISEFGLRNRDTGAAAVETGETTGSPRREGESDVS